MMVMMVMMMVINTDDDYLNDSADDIRKMIDDRDVDDRDRF